MGFSVETRRRSSFLPEKVSTLPKTLPSVAYTVRTVCGSTSYACSHCTKMPPGSRRSRTAR
jgi:hypothetical protein